MYELDTQYNMQNRREKEVDYPMQRFILTHSRLKIPK